MIQFEEQSFAHRLACVEHDELLPAAFFDIALLRVQAHSSLLSQMFMIMLSSSLTQQTQGSALRLFRIFEPHTLHSFSSWPLGQYI